MKNQNLGCCGIECNNCPILYAYKDLEEAEKVIGLFRDVGKIKKEPEIKKPQKNKEKLNAKTQRRKEEAITGQEVKFFVFSLRILFLVAMDCRNSSASNHSCLSAFIGSTRAALQAGT